MRRSMRGKKPVVIFDPSSAKPLQEENHHEDFDALVNNPWNVTNFEAFMLYECPQCAHKSKDLKVFATHAASNHSQAREFLHRMANNGVLPLDSVAVQILNDQGVEEEANEDTSEVAKKPKEAQTDSFQCYVCGLERANKQEVIDHCSTHFENVKSSMYGLPREFQCGECKLMFKTPGSLGLHVCGQLPPRWTGNYSEAKKCPDCGKVFKKRYDLLGHIAKVHTKSKNFQCGECDYKASVPFLLLKHQRRKHGEHQRKNHLCHDCGSMFTERTHLMSHIRYVCKLVKEEAFCYTCGLTHRTKSGMAKHLQEAHNKKVNREESSDPSKPFRCGACVEEFVNSDQLQQHLRSTHQDLKPQNSESGGSAKAKVKYQYACTECGKLVSNKYSLEYHINKVHELVKPYPCTQCHEAFFDSQSLKKHEDRHNGKHTYTCRECHKNFASQSLCQRHVKSMHERNEVYVCETCGFKTFHANSLTTHIQQVHEKLRPHKCGHCDEAFFYKRDLEKHCTKVHQIETTTITYAVIEEHVA